MSFFFKPEHIVHDSTAHFLLQVRVSLASSRIIPIPKTAEETIDYKSKELYIDNIEKDTTADAATKVGITHQQYYEYVVTM